MKVDDFNTQITDTWGFYDIQDRVRDRLDNKDFILDIDEGVAVLNLMESSYDAGVGYNWAVVDICYKQVTGITL